LDRLLRALRVAAHIAAAAWSRSGGNLSLPDRQPQELALGPHQLAPDAPPLRLAGPDAVRPPPADHLF